MRVAILAPLVTPLRPEQMGGSQALVVDLAVGLKEREHDVTIFAAEGSVVEGVSTEEIEVDASRMSKNLFRPELGWRREAIDVLRETFARAYDQISKGTFDVVHNHGFDPPAFSEASRCGLPVVHTLHLPYDDEVAVAIDEMDESQPALTVAVSKAQSEDWGNRVDRIVPNGVPVNVIPWRPKRQGFALFAGRLSPEKGTIEAIQIARRAGIPLFIAGSEYDPGYAEQVRAAADEKVTFLGSLARTKLWEVMSRAQVLLAPSRWNEAFGLAVAEAQAAGCPVVAFDRGALNEVVEDGISGFVVGEGDLDAAADALHKCFDLDPHDVRLSAEQRLNLSQMITGYEDVYAQVVITGERWVRVLP